MRCSLAVASAFVSLAVAGLPAQAFTRVAGGPAAASPPSQWQLAPDVQLRLADGELLIESAGGLMRPACTRDGGPGRVHAATLERSGRAVVAAERGLFVLDAEHPVLDPMDLGDGVPVGEPLGVFADERHRIWLCTEREFGVLDGRFGFGRTFTAADGVPPPPYCAVTGGADGTILLRAEGGVFAYRPDSGPAPVCPGGVSRGELVADRAGEAAFRVDVEALGGATFRQRQKHHHVLRAAPDSRLHGLRPGRHVVDLYAIDRDLRRTLIAEFTVHMPPPPALDARMLPLIALAGTAVLFALSWPRRGRRRLLRAVTRTVLVGVLALQVIAALLGYGRSWPFVGFSMYTENWHENDVLYKPRVLGLRADGSTEVRTDFHLPQDGHWQMLAEVLHGDDEARHGLLEKINAFRPPSERVVGFEIADKRIRLTREGPVDVAPTPLLRWTR
jgi:hypothetical protein